MSVHADSRRQGKGHGPGNPHSPAPGKLSRDFWLYWTAGSADSLGTQVSGLALPLYLLSTGASPAVAGVVVSAAGLTGLTAGPFAAVFADRGSRRPIMVVSALVAGAAMGAVTALVALGRPSLPTLVAATVVERIATSCYASAAGGTFARIVPTELYPGAMGRLQAGDQGAVVAGPALAGLLFRAARCAPFLLDAASYAVTAACVGGIRADLGAARSPQTAPDDRDRAAEDRAAEDRAAEDRSSLVAELANGLRFVRADVFLRFALLWSLGVNAALTLLYYNAVFAFRLQGKGTGALGLVLTVCGGAGLLGAMAAPMTARRFRPFGIVVAASWAMAPAAAGLSFTGQVWAYGLLLGAVSSLVPMVMAALQARAVLVTPAGMQARVSTVLGTASAAVAALVPAGTGLLADAAGVTRVDLICAALLILLAGYATAAARRRPGTGSSAQGQVTGSGERP